MASEIIGLFPPHKAYIEPFGGSGAVLLAKQPSTIEVYNDIDEELVNLFQVLRDPVLNAELELQLSLTPYARTEFNLAKQASGNPVERARRLMVRQRQSFGASGSTWAFSAKDIGHAASVVQRWQNGLARLPAALRRLASVQIECKPWNRLVTRMDSTDSLFYVDPPYEMQTRVSGGYANEMDSQAHESLVKALLGLKGMCVLSGYDTPLYRPLDDAGWVRRQVEVVCFSSDKRAKRSEVLWMCPRVAAYVASKSNQLDLLETL